MTKEQEELNETTKAVDKQEQEEAINYFSGYEEGDNITITCDFLDCAEKIINALRSKDRAIDLMKEEIADLKESVNQIYDDYQDIGKMAFDYSDKIEEQDKIIDLMAEELTTPIHSKKWVKQYFENKAKEYKVVTKMCKKQEKVLVKM